MASSRNLIPTTKQLKLDLQIAAEREVDGVGMGVLNDGTPYLTVRGLARMCGVDHMTIIRITNDWRQNPPQARERKIKELVREQGADDSVPLITITQNGSTHHAIPSAICMAVLEYYAFEAKTGKSDSAANSYRLLARKGFRDFIYAYVGYNPADNTTIAWQQFKDRHDITYHATPAGYFSIFTELADFFLALIHNKAALGPSFIPDISVGQHWSKHWASGNLEALHGDRMKYEHNYPLYFPQANSNPQHPFCYPDAALGEFRRWIREVYLPQCMPEYLSGKVKQGQITPPAATTAIAAFERKTNPKAITRR